jgi:hypothetical protein
MVIDCKKSFYCQAPRLALKPSVVRKTGGSSPPIRIVQIFPLLALCSAQSTKMARRADQTARNGWDGDLMDLQNETQKLLATVRSTPSRSRSTKNSERKEPRVDDGLGKKKKKRKAKTTTEETKTPSSRTTLDLGRETVEILDTASNPVSARSSEDEDDYDLKKNVRGVGAKTRFQETKQEVTSRHLDFETEKARVKEVKIK